MTRPANTVTHRLLQAKAAYTTTRIDLGDGRALRTDAAPTAGDLLLARVGALGQHARIERTDGRRARLFRGDEVLVCYGNRYAPDQFESTVPGDLKPCHLVAAGGVASKVLSRHGRMRQPTSLTPIGLVADAAGSVLNLSRYALPQPTPPAGRPYTVAVVGTSMNAGKTTTAASLVHGLVRSGLRVGAAKVTGTGAGGDLWFLGDAGAEQVLDFTDAGLVSTYHQPLPTLERCFRTLTGHLAHHGMGAIVLEVADGLYQAETAALLQSEVFRTGVDALVFAAGDAMGAVAGSLHLEQLGYTVLAISGVLTRAPLAIREARAASGLPVMTCEQIARCDWRRMLPARSSQLPPRPGTARRRVAPVALASAR